MAETVPPLTRRELRAAREEQDATSLPGDEERVEAPLSSDSVAPINRTADPARSERADVRGVFGAIGRGLLVGVLVLLLGIAAAAIVVPAAVGGTALTVMTSSMEPTLPAGTLVVVRPTAAADIREGDVLTYQLHSGEPTLVTHRVVERSQLTTGEYRWVTQGDANPTPDPDIVQEVQAVGTVWYAIPYLGWVSAALTGPWRVFVIPIVVIALFGYAAWMVIGALRERARGRARS
ncbi:signal peptidase I [Microbacterium gorillae]|uniref:signal peptidase I n=1 Tax=Microbacterium gorillae TaxID=1231063 RepID=UPI000B9B46C2|nr:signal peptidase I [Microbacterium gorillae]